MPHLQQVLQHSFQGLQIRCALKRGALQIPVEHLSSVELNPGDVFWALEQTIQDFTPSPIPVTPNGDTSVQRLPVQVSLKVVGDKRAYVCHSFTLTLTTTTAEVAPAHPERTISGDCTEPGFADIEAAWSRARQDSSNSPEACIFLEEARAPAIEGGQARADLPPPVLALPAAAGERTPVIKILGKVNPWIAGVASAALLSVGVSYYAFSQASPTPPPTAAAAVSVTAVTALGRIEPKGEVIKLSVANAEDSRVEQLLGEEGDRVEAEQVIAILQGLDKKRASLTEAEQNVAIARAKMAQVQSGDAKVSELAAQQANIARLEAQLRTQMTSGQAEVVRVETELRNAEATYERYRRLYQAGATSLSEVETAQKNSATVRAQLTIAQAQLDNTVSTLQQQIQQERLQLSNLSEVRPVDVQVAQAELNYALTQVEKANAELEDLYVKVPIAGQILKINTRIGEQVNTINGIVELGQTDQMYVIAEVYETDVGKIRLGQQAAIVSENGGFEGKVHGTVEHIGLQIGKNNVLNSDPAAAQDARVVEVKIRITPDDTPRIAGLTNMQVRVHIDLAEASAESR